MLRTAFGLLLATFVASAMSATATKVSLADALPIELQEVGQSDSLSHVRLYELPKEHVPNGAKIQFVGRYSKSQGRLVFCDPPWMHVTWEDQGRDGQRLQQAFQVRPDQLPSQASDGAMFRVQGKISRHRPDLSYREREEQSLHHFNLTDTKLQHVPFNVTDEAARKTYAQEIDRARMRLETLCKKFGLTYAGPQEDTPNLSWYRGKLAVTATVTKKPGLSFSPVPYATVSLLIDPATGKPLSLVMQRRIHQDPRD